jgi:hypothetical protein
MPFLETFDPQQIPPPYYFRNVQVNAFMVPIDLAYLQGFCDTYLNIGAGYRYQAMVPFGYLMVLNYPSLVSEDPKFAGMGYVTQKEIYINFPVVRLVAASGNFLLPMDFSWAFPFIAVNDATSAISGREILGFRKLLGEIETATDPDGRFSASLALPSFKTFGRDVPQRTEPILSVKTGLPLGGGTAMEHLFPWSLLGHDSVADSIEDTWLGMIADIAPGLMSVINLKQFREAQHPTMAAYQALVGCDSVFANCTAPSFYDGAEYQIYPNASLDENGSPTGFPPLGTTGKSLMSLQFSADLRFDNVRNLYRFTAAGTPPAPPPFQEAISDCERFLLSGWRLFTLGMVS